MEWQIVHAGDIGVYQTACAQLQIPGATSAVYDATKSCDLTNAVAGCQNSGNPPPLITTWFYAPYYNSSVVAAACKMTVVFPPAGG
jgi:hypothetical protein